MKRVMQIKSAEPFNEPVDPIALDIPVRGSSFLRIILEWFWKHLGQTEDAIYHTL